MRRRRRQGFLCRLTLEWLSARLYGPGAAADGAVAALGAAKDAVAPWWAECSKEAFNTGLDQLARALTNWGASRRGKRKGRPAGFPRFRSRRRARPSIRFTTGALRCQARHAVLPRIGRVKLHEDGRRLAVADASFGEFRRQVEYKARWRGGRVIVADRWFASSKTCSGCGAVKSKLPLSERTGVEPTVRPGLPGRWP
jgi:transposase